MKPRNPVSNNSRLVSEWHSALNGDLKPENFSIWNRQRIWWQCPISEDHIWNARINERQQTNCPCCAGKKVVISNCLATTHPEIALQWHPTKNGNLTPYDVVAGSDKKIWWKCPVDKDHEWQVRIADRKNLGCPCCSNQKVVLSNCLAATHPQLIQMWDGSKNQIITPYNVVAGSNKKYWWKCPVADDHQWKTSVNHIAIQGTSCPFCLGRKVSKSNCLKTTNPNLADQWHPSLNENLTPYDVTLGSNKKVWWQCPIIKEHEWYAYICNRKNSGCPYCAGQRVNDSNCLATYDSKFIAEWHPTLNKDLTVFNVTISSGKAIWWQCLKNKNHIWQNSISNRTHQDQECPYCNRQSSGELLVDEILKSLNVNHKQQFKINACKNKRNLVFDFAVFQDNLIKLIEIQGRQHKEPVAFGGMNKDRAKQYFKEQVYRDQIKKEYCQKNNIPFLEIWHDKRLLFAKNYKEKITKQLLMFLAG